METITSLIQKKTVIFFASFMIIAGGFYAYFNIGKLEDPEFSIKQAMIITTYPGAKPEKVEELVTEPIEKAIQKIPELKTVRSISRTGLSFVYVDIKEKYRKKQLPQIWDTLRRRIYDAQASLPPGAGPSIIQDDFGDVFGIFLALSGTGYSYTELRDFAEELQKELLLVESVARVELWGEQQEVVTVEINREKMAAMGIHPHEIIATFANHDLITNAGSIEVGDLRIPVFPDGNFQSVEEIENLIIRGRSAEELILLKDFALIRRDYQEPPLQMLRFNGERAIGLAISASPGVNVIKMGAAVRKKIDQLMLNFPEDLKLGTISYQSETVTESINNFIRNLGASVFIVVGVLLLTMGLRSGLIIGSSLIFSILACLMVMYIMKIDMQRTSLASLIIAMGMLVDNAIVITEGILSGLQKGKSRLKSINDTIAESFWPLLGATLIAILAFLPVYLSPDDTGEYCASLFLVISISLILSWLLAIFQTPVFCDVFLPRSREKTEITTVNKLNQKSPTEKILLHYRNFLEKSIKKPQITAYSVGLVLILSIISFSFVEQIFFPASTRKQFYVDYWLPEGTRIEKTRDDIIRIEQEILSYQEVESISSAVGNSPPRFYISYKPETPNPAYGVIFINVHDHRDIKKLKKRLGTYLQNNFPGASPRVREFVLGVPVDFKSEIRISGQNSETLRKIATEISEKLRRSPFSGEVRHDWREAILAIEPLFSQEKARRSLVSRKDVGDTFKRLNEGVTVGLFREKNRLMPVRIRAASSERKNIENFIDAPVFGSSLNPVPLSQLVTKLNPFFMNSLIIRRNRKRTITVQSDPAPGINAANYLKAIKPLVESVRLPDGYELQWAGEVAESAKASQAVLQFIPPVFFIMCIIIILLFNSLRHLLLLLICLPLALVGVSFGLLLFKQPFGFMAMLGSLSLFGMFIKNAIVLLDQIEIERKEGKEFYESVIEASVSRMRPVIMASLTTILGMLPLAADALYSAMAVAIMSGLLFATLLTLIVVPVLYTKIMK